MTQFLRRLGFAALMTGVATCPLESAVAQSNDKTEPWETEWKVDRMTDAKTFVLSTDVRTEGGYYQLTLKCEPNDIAIVLMAFTKDKEPRRITPDFRATRRVHVRIDRHPVLDVDFVWRDYYNRLQANFGVHSIFRHDRPWLEVRRQFLASKSILIGNVFPDEIFEVKTGFDQATIDACNQSSAPKTKSEDKPREPASPSDTGGQRTADSVPRTSTGESCLKVDSSTPIKVEGILGTSSTITLPNGRKYTGYIVMLPKPICADVFFASGGLQGRVRGINQVQLVPEIGMEIGHLMGKRVVANGTAFGQHTAYHVAPVVLSLKEIAEQRQ